MLLPVRLGVLAKYGEGPHMTRAGVDPDRAGVHLAGAGAAAGRPPSGSRRCFRAAVVSNNFYGATALAMFYPILVWSFWITRQDKRILAPALVIPALAYGLTAFWLVPSYFKVTAENMKYVSEHGTTWSIWVAVAVAVAFAIATDRLARGQAAAHLGRLRRRQRRLLHAERTRQLLISISASRASPCARCPNST